MIACVFYSGTSTIWLMKKFTTPLVDDEKGKVVAPSDKTIVFLKSYARSFYTDNRLPVPINTMCVN